MINFLAVTDELEIHHKLAFFLLGQSGAQQAINDICQGKDLISSALLWHVVTDITCMVSDEMPSKFRTCNQYFPTSCTLSTSAS
jgi:hypothetical protein